MVAKLTIRSADEGNASEVRRGDVGIAISP